MKLKLFIIIAFTLSCDNKADKSEKSKDSYKLNLENGFVNEPIHLFYNSSLKHLDTVSTFENLGFAKSYEIPSDIQTISLKSSNDSIIIYLKDFEYYGINLLNNKLIIRKGNCLEKFNYE